MSCKFRSLFLAAILVAVSAGANAASSFVGRWALTLPNGRAGWLGVAEADGQLQASLLWASGSVLPVQEVTETDGVLHFSRPFKANDRETVQRFRATRHGDRLELAVHQLQPDGSASPERSFSGTRIAELPPAPDLRRIVFGDGIPLLRDDNLASWQLLPADANNGWSLHDGVLRNRVDKSRSGRWGNLRTDATFEDFRLTAEVRTLPESNSGIYLRGIYEVQVRENFGQPLDAHNMGALYSRITPAVAAEKPISEWQTLDITLVQRHLTVILNGVTIIDNAPVLGCTGGALTSDESLPGPILLQGDHTDIDYRNLILYPVQH